MLASICDECASLSHKLCLILTPHYYGQFALSLGKTSTYIFSLNSTCLKRALSMTPSVSVLTGFDSVITSRYSTPVQLKQFFDQTTFLKCSTLSFLFFLRIIFLPMVRGSARDKVVVY